MKIGGSKRKTTKPHGPKRTKGRKRKYVAHDEPGVPEDEMEIAARISAVGGMQPYEVVDIDDLGAEIRYQYDDVARALIAFDRREAIATAPDQGLAALVADLPASEHSDPNWQDRVLDTIDRTESLDDVDQTEPAMAPDAPLVDMPDRHSDDEPTHVGTVDERFDMTDGEL